MQQVELEAYVYIGDLLTYWQSKARQVFGSLDDEMRRILQYQLWRPLFFEETSR